MASVLGGMMFRLLTLLAAMTVCLIQNASALDTFPKGQPGKMRGALFENFSAKMETVCLEKIRSKISLNAKIGCSLGANFLNFSKFIQERFYRKEARGLERESDLSSLVSFSFKF